MPERIIELRVVGSKPVRASDFPSDVNGKFAWGTLVSGNLLSVVAE
jgi:hypothetical protein